MKVILNVVRIQLLNWSTTVVYRLGLLAALLPLGLVIDITNGANTPLGPRDLPATDDLCRGSPRAPSDDDADVPVHRGAQRHPLVFQRWRQTGLYLAGITTSALVAGVTVLVTSQGWWPAIEAFITGQSALTVFAGFPLVFALLVGCAGWMSIRRATP